MNYLGFERKDAKATVDALNWLLASYHIYYQNLRNFHWNIEGENFFDLHAQFEELYHDARLKIDAIAERILSLRYRPISKISDLLDISVVKEADILQEDRAMILCILNNHKVLIRQMRDVLKKANAIEDDGTIDMIGSYLQDLEKKSWMLEAWSRSKVSILE